ncbi:hypothetical protein NFX46_20250 [Streptomyces phaeoluteigriseus]|uniref:Lipoyl-binding domain-containing protein n=1 Tax=Streptomyces phaeoluteigriseus TaxID=114686 RepID=A0ABY4ZBE0_9ACTN|nr:biotin/lipoyl-containing protein [Streptomyces phaeoluteigriseus]USQ85863.1 hypothetical protein NFX46_20250 [Streptomyces phaeoluteigriseus]
MSKSVRKRVPRIVGASCLVAAFAFSVSGTPAAAQTAACLPESSSESSPSSSPEQAGVTKIVMPFLSESVNEGTVSWQAQLGEIIYEGDWLLDVSTNKVDMSVDSPVAGVLIEICVADDETAQVGETLGVIGPAGSAPLTAE